MHSTQCLMFLLRECRWKNAPIPCYVPCILLWSQINLRSQIWWSPPERWGDWGSDRMLILGLSPAATFSNCMPFYRVNFIFASIINSETWLSKRDVLSTVKALGNHLMQERGWGYILRETSDQILRNIRNSFWFRNHKTLGRGGLKLPQRTGRMWGQSGRGRRTQAEKQHGWDPGQGQAENKGDWALESFETQMDAEKQ